jgi:hypothetical protein
MRNPLLLLALVCGPLAAPLLACATCFGRSDSALAQGMNMGILFLLAVIGVVLAGIAGFMIFLARRAAQLRRSAA